MANIEVDEELYNALIAERDMLKQEQAALQFDMSNLKDDYIKMARGLAPKGDDNPAVDAFDEYCSKYYRDNIRHGKK